MLNNDYIKEELEKEVSKKRFIHSIGVAKTAVKLAKNYGINSEKAKIAGLLHDFTKDWTSDKLGRIIIESDELTDDVLEYSKDLWHGPVASIIIQDKFGITDNDIIMAVRYHTSGRRNMTLLEKIICLADYIEPNRDFNGVDKIRELSKKNINEALLCSFDGSIEYLIKKGVKIYPLTLEARNCLIEEIERN